MSDMEYLDLFLDCQKRKCPYRAYLFDIKNSGKHFSDIENFRKFHKFVTYMTTKLYEMNTDSQQVFRCDENNIPRLPEFEKKLKNIVGPNSVSNPFILGDCACFYVNEDSITQKEVLKLAVSAMKKFDIDFEFHFLSGKYETDVYEEGGRKMYKGYMPRILEDLSKKSSQVISRNTKFEELEF